jgi:hypothetical protein
MRDYPDKTMRLITVYLRRIFQKSLGKSPTIYIASRGASNVVKEADKLSKLARKGKVKVNEKDPDLTVEFRLMKEK